MTETWRPVVGFEGLYEVSDHGRVRSLNRVVVFRTRWGNQADRLVKGRVLRACGGEDGYLSVNLWAAGQVLHRNVHTLVADAFLGPQPLGTEVCHRDGNKRHNAASNLRRDTPAGNNADKLSHGTLLRGSECPWSKLTEADVKEIRGLRGAFSQSELADRYGVSRPHISEVQSGKAWAHV